MEESSVPLPLPTYNIFRLAKEDPLSFSILSAVITIIITILIRKFRNRRAAERTERKLELSQEGTAYLCRLSVKFIFQRK